MKDRLFEFYGIFCGVFLFKGKKHNYLNDWQPWLKRVSDPDSFGKHLRTTYYETYLHSILPEVTNSTPTAEDVLHLTSSDFASKKRIIEIEISNTLFTVPYFDVLLFPNQIGIYFFKVHPVANEVTADQVSGVLKFFRNGRNLMRVNGSEVAIENLVADLLSSVSFLDDEWNKFSPQLKSYTIINDKHSAEFSHAHDHLLFELANATPVGSYGRSLDAPSTAFFERIFNENCTAIFSNWKALSLFDSFTRLSISSSDPFKTWEQDYLHLYLLCLYSKYQLYHFNSQLTNVVRVSRATQQLKNEFVEFTNDHNHAYVSYKFLPNHLFEKMSSALAIQKEIDQIETKSRRLSEAYSEQKSRQLNLLILALSMLSVISVLADVSEWLAKMGVSEKLVYSPLFSLTLTATPVLIFLITRRVKGI